MKKITYSPRGVCSRTITVELDENDVITDVQFIGGCAGNTQGVATLAVGRKARDVADAVGGILCGTKGTSCPDQLALALREALASDAAAGGM